MFNKIFLKIRELLLSEGKIKGFAWLPFLGAASIVMGVVGLIWGPGAIIEAPMKLALWIITLVVGLISYLATFLLTIAITIAGWFMALTMDIPIIRDAAGNPSWAMAVGWTFTRNLVNMFFIVILAWIGIATILRLAEYQTGKIFFNLIIIALLVNFSPLLVGLVVDVSNLIASYFIQGVLAPGNNPDNSALHSLLGNPQNPGNFGIVGAASSNMLQMLWATFTLRGTVQDMVFRLAIIVVYSVFFFIAALIFGLLAFLYLFRVIAFWILLILAPLAFVAYILPQTRRFWSFWWHQLIQWALVGITAAFFVFLAFTLLDATAVESFQDPNTGLSVFFPRIENADVSLRYCIDDQPTRAQIQADCERAQRCSGSPTPDCTSNPPRYCLCASLAAQFLTRENAPNPLANFIGDLLPMFVVLVFLGTGLFLGFSSSAMGASMVIGWGKGIGGWMGTQGKERLKQLRSKISDVLPERVKQKAKEWATTELAATTPGWKGTLLRTATTVSGIGWARRSLGLALGPGLVEAEQRDISQAEKEIEQLEKEGRYSPERIVAMIHRTSHMAKKIGYINQLIKKGDLDDAIKANLTIPEISEILTHATRYNAHQEIVSAMPHLVKPAMQHIGNVHNVTTVRAYGDTTLTPVPGIPYSPGFLSKIKPQRAGNISMSALRDPDVVEAIVRYWDGAKMGKLLENLGPDAAAQIENTIINLAQQVGLPPHVWLENVNQKLFRWIRRSPAAQGYFSRI